MKCLVPFLAMLLAGCSKPAPPAPPAAQNPVTPAEATPAAKTAAEKVSYPGTWSVADGDGQPFEILVFPNGQAVSNWTKGASGAQGERGFWRVDDNRLLVVFNDGWTDVISPTDAGFVHRGFEPGAPLDGAPNNESPSKKIEGDEFTGVWRLNQEPDGSYLYVALQSDGRALSTVAGGTEGTWERTKDGVLCKWPDGWNDLIFSTSDGYRKRSWVGPTEQDTTPPDVSPAMRVGEAGFSITP